LDWVPSLLGRSPHGMRINLALLSHQPVRAIRIMTTCDDVEKMLVDARRHGN
jgi:hypothetical protein